jgi:hypothetical protein
MAAVIGRGIERLTGEMRSSDDEVYDPNNRNRNSGLQSPFVLYFTVVISLNAVAILGGIASEFDLHRNNYYYFNFCDAWLFTNALFGVAHIGAAIYIVRRIRKPVRATHNDAVYVTAYRLHDPRDHKMSKQPDVEANTAAVAAVSKATNDDEDIVEPPLEGEPDTLRRVRHVLCESKVVAGYIFIWVAYVCWHVFVNMRACNLGMAFAMRCGDIFIWAAPFSFAFSVAKLMGRRGR